MQLGKPHYPLISYGECYTAVLHCQKPDVSIHLFLKDIFAADDWWRREWDSLPLSPDCAKTAAKQGFPKNPAELCDHRRVPPIRPVGRSISTDFRAAEDRHRAALTRGFHSSYLAALRPGNGLPGCRARGSACGRCRCRSCAAAPGRRSRRARPARRRAAGPARSGRGGGSGRPACECRSNSAPHRRRRDPFKPLTSLNGIMGPPRRSWSAPRAETQPCLRRQGRSRLRRGHCGQPAEAIEAADPKVAALYEADCSQGHLGGAKLLAENEYRAKSSEGKVRKDQSERRLLDRSLAADAAKNALGQPSAPCLSKTRGAIWVSYAISIDEEAR
jgi:hypothetical protein